MPEPNVMTADADLTKKINESKSPDELIAALEAAKAAPVVEEKKPPEAKPAEPPKPVTDTFVIAGEEVEVTGVDQADVNRQVKALLAGAKLGADAAKPPDPAPKQKTAEELQADRFELESQFRQGKITAQDYLEKSGAFEDHLKKQGISSEDLKKVVDQAKADGQTKAWETATSEFVGKFAVDGKKWLGGKRTLNLMGTALHTLGLSDKPSVESLQRAYDYLTEQGWNVIELGEQDAAALAAKTQEPDKSKPPQTGAGEEIRATPPPAPATPPPAAKPRSGSAMFNVSGGQGTREPGGEKGEIPVIKPDDTPEQIMAKYKEAAIKNGQNPDDILRQSYSGRQA